MVTRFESFNTAIYAIYRDMTKIERTVMEKHNLKGAYALYLMAIARTPDGVTSSQLCEICDKDKAAVSRAISELEQKGLIIRTANNDSYYRARLKLTDQGKVITQEVTDMAQLAVAKVTQGMKEENRQIMYECLGLIAANLQKLCQEGLPEA